MRLASKYLRIDAQIYARVDTAAAPKNNAMELYTAGNPSTRMLTRRHRHRVAKVSSLQVFVSRTVIVVDTPFGGTFIVGCSRLYAGFLADCFGNPPASLRSDAAGLSSLAVHLLLLLLGWSLQTAQVVADSGFWVGTVLPTTFTAVVLTFLFCPLHECLHYTAFRSRWLNDAVAAVVGFALVLPPHYFRLFHWDHHKHVNDPERDPEIRWNGYGDSSTDDALKTSDNSHNPSGATAGTEKGRLLVRTKPYPTDAADWVVHLSGYRYWKERITTTIAYACGRCSETDEFVRDRDKRSVVREARCYLLAYVAVAVAGSLAPSNANVSGGLLKYWLLPALVGQPFLRMYLVFEHTGCELQQHQQSLEHGDGYHGGRTGEGRPIANAAPSAAGRGGRAPTTLPQQQQQQPQQQQQQQQRGEIAAKAFKYSRTWADRLFPRIVIKHLFWNMPFHSEHHALPAVPFHALPAVHEYMLDSLRVADRLQDATTSCNSLRGASETLE